MHTKGILAALAIAAVLPLGAAAQSATTTKTRTPISYSRTTTATGANGKTATYQRNASYGNGTYSSSRSLTGPQGGTRSVATTRANGMVTRTWTGRGGNSRTRVRRAR